MSSMGGIFDKAGSGDQQEREPKTTAPKLKYPDVTEYQTGQHLVGEPRRMPKVKKNVILSGAN